MILTYFLAGRHEKKSIKSITSGTKYANRDI